MKPSKSSNDYSNVVYKKAIAQRRILNSLYYHGSRSNQELSKELVMTTPSVTVLLNNLIKEGVIEKRGVSHSQGGRKPMQYGLKADFGYILAIDMDQFNTRMVIFNLGNEHVSKVKSFGLKLDNDPKTLVTLISEIKILIKESKIPISKMLGVGISMPGIVNTNLGINYTFLNTSKSESLRNILQEQINLPVYIENDASVLALAESRFGSAKGVQNLLVVKIHWGVGLGMLLNGKLYRGHAGMAGEFSHIPLADNEILCSCGKQGCLETETSAHVLVKLAKEGIKNGELSSLKKLVNGDIDKIEADMIIKAASMGDQYSVQILSLIGYKLGKGISILVHLFNPEMIVFTGSLAKARQFIMVPIQQAMNKYCIPRILDTTELAISNLNDDIGLIGAMVLAIDNIFKSDIA